MPPDSKINKAALVDLAALLHLAVAGYAMEGIAFITYYPAIIIAALVSGFGQALRHEMMQLTYRFRSASLTQGRLGYSWTSPL